MITLDAITIGEPGGSINVNFNIAEYHNSTTALLLGISISHHRPP